MQTFDFSGMKENMNAILQDLDQEQYPETHDFLEGYLEEIEDIEEIDDDTAMEMVSELIICDRTAPMEPEIAKVVMSVLGTIAGEGDDEAMFLTAQMLETGRAGEKDLAKAIEYYQTAADKGHMEALEHMGCCYYYGNGIPVDYATAFACFLKGALLGQLRSLYMIGDMYRLGQLVEEDPDLAINIYLNCLSQLTEPDVAEYGADITMRLADCFADGVGCEATPESALTFYQQAENLLYARINAGDYTAMEQLKHVLIQQQKCRIQVLGQLPDFDWAKREL